MVNYIESKDLADLILRDKNVLIVDIAKIIGSINVPYHFFQSSLPDLKTLAIDYEIVVFHCRLSAQRGPSAAEIFENEFENYTGANRPIVLVLRGGFEQWHKLYYKVPELCEHLYKE